MTIEQIMKHTVPENQVWRKEVLKVCINHLELPLLYPFMEKLFRK